MKTLAALIAVYATLALCQSVHADFNTDAIEKGVVCHYGSNFVKINKARTKIIVGSGFDPGHPESYDVVDRNSDGDTFVSYISQDQDVVLTFSDQGDELQFRDTHETVSLDCPQ